MATEPETVRGTLGLDIYAPGSKGEYRAVVLTTASGDRLVVRRIGANPYDDPELVALAGTDIEATGRRHRDILLVDDYTLILTETPQVTRAPSTAPADPHTAESAEPPTSASTAPSSGNTRGSAAPDTADELNQTDRHTPRPRTR